MKKAKVSHKHGRIEHVWPWEKTLPDGSKVIKNIPPIYLAKPDKFAHCIIDVPDEVQPGWRWNGKEYRPKEEVIKPKPPKHSPVIEVLARRLGVSYDELHAEVMAEKKAGKIAKTPQTN